MSKLRNKQSSSDNGFRAYIDFRCATVSMVEHTAVNRGGVGPSPTRGVRKGP